LAKTKEMQIGGINGTGQEFGTGVDLLLFAQAGA
jgi:hypothetical protein